MLARSDFGRDLKNMVEVKSDELWSRYVEVFSGVNFILYLLLQEIHTRN
jgi:hypothetical protein